MKTSWPLKRLRTSTIARKLKSLQKYTINGDMEVKFGNTVKPLTPKVFMHNENIAIKVKGKYITSESELTKTFNSHCINTFKNGIVLVPLLLVNFEHISHLVLLFLLLTLSSQILAGLVFPLLETTFMLRKNSKFSLLQSEKLISLLKI